MLEDFNSRSSRKAVGNRPRQAADHDPSPGASVFDEPDEATSDRAAAIDNRSFDVPAPVEPETPVPEFQPPPKRRRRGRWLRWLLLAVLLILIAGAAEMVYLSRTFSGIERVDTEGSLSTAGAAGENFLIVGSDSRENFDPDAPADGSVASVGGERTDTIVLLRVEPDRNLMLPLPRDLWVQIAGTGGEQRINTAIQGGPSRLIDTIESSLGIPVHHYVEIDFAGFKGLVDALGGIEINFEHAAYDRKSGLDIATPGPQVLDGDEALSYVRSRTYTEIVDGAERVDGTADLGRIQRQQTFLRATFAKITAVRNPLTLNRIAGSVTDDVRIDDNLSFGAAADFARKLSASSPETVELAVANAKRGSAAVLVLADGAQQALDRFR